MGETVIVGAASDGGFRRSFIAHELPSLLALMLTSSLVSAADNDNQPPVEEDVAAGHSYHGDVFNEGPRQRAVLNR